MTAQPAPEPTALPDPGKVVVLGAGSWGTAFAKVAADAARRTGEDAASEETTSEETARQHAGPGSARGPAPAWRTVLWGRDAEAMAAMSSERTNARYFPGETLPENLEFTADGAEALAGADVVVLALPAQVLREQLTAMRELVPQDAVLVSLAKGLERGTGLRMSEVIGQVLPGAAGRVAVVSGPNLAREIVRQQPTASVVAARDETVAAAVARICAADYFRPYTSVDVVGVEIGGLVKNVIALSVGICEGRDYGDNSKASIMTRGLAETTRLALALGGLPETMAGLAGMGDLVATCSSSLSRNHTAGKLLGSGLTEAQVAERTTQTAEGIKSAPVVLELARAHGVEMPIVESVAAVLSGRITVENLEPLLLGRRLKAETTHRAPDGASTGAVPQTSPTPTAESR